MSQLHARVRQAEMRVNGAASLRMRFHAHFILSRMCASPSLSFLSVLSAHLQKLTISTSGAGLLARDMKQYQVVFSSFHLAAVLDKFTELRQLCDIFFVSPQYLLSVISDSEKLAHLSINNSGYLLAFVQRGTCRSEHIEQEHAMTSLHTHTRAHARNEIIIVRHTLRRLFHSQRIAYIHCTIRSFIHAFPLVLACAIEYST
jgi:hypothetical protein